jgi:Cof subfamily protein (haloacid dehalogenase superfamily)
LRERDPAITLSQVLLFATDLDGTLVDREDGIHPRDAAAIAAARARGVIVTIATGRLTSRTHPIAKALQLDTPLVCADGGVLACSTTQRVLRRRFVPHEIAEQVLEAFRAGSLASCVMTDDVIHVCHDDDVYHRYLRGWSHSITAHADVRSAVVWRDEPEAAIMLVGIGDAATAAAVIEALAPHVPTVDVISFETATGAHVVRVMARGASKGAALSDLANELEIEPSHVAVAGDWLNDLSMFAYAGRSFAMPHAPPEVRAAATHALEHDIARHGAFADALEQWLREMG